jgi:hypothetical protein
VATVEHESELRGDAGVLGRLVERRQQRRKRARARLPRSWKKLERSERRAWF